MGHLNIKVQGNVQRVYYRASAKEAAIQNHVTGFVRNESDGSVYIEVEGSDENLNSFIEWCWKGTPSSEVEEVMIEDGDLKNFSDFVISD
ncbi:MAG: acylphosphatase [Bacteroidetes bacterium]|nr:acylphosphatase [Bacteroidota bacterium]